MKMMVVSSKTVAANGGRLDANAYIPGGRPYEGRSYKNKGDQKVTLYARDHGAKRAWRFYASETWLREHGTVHCPTCGHTVSYDGTEVEKRVAHGFPVGELTKLFIDQAEKQVLGEAPDVLQRLCAVEVPYSEFMSSQRCA
jgi:hypothetical protein